MSSSSHFSLSPTHIFVHSPPQLYVNETVFRYLNNILTHPPLNPFFDTPRLSLYLYISLDSYFFFLNPDPHTTNSLHDAIIYICVCERSCQCHFPLYFLFFYLNLCLPPSLSLSFPFLLMFVCVDIAILYTAAGSSHVFNKNKKKRNKKRKKFPEKKPQKN